MKYKIQIPNHKDYCFEDKEINVDMMVKIAILIIWVIILGIDIIIMNNDRTKTEVRIASEQKYVVQDICNMERIGSNIYCDRITGVLYYHDNGMFSGGYNPIYNADGTLKNIKDYEKN